MIYSSTFASPFGELKLYSDEEYLKELMFPACKSQTVFSACKEYESQPIKLAKLWLYDYFSGSVPKQSPRLLPEGTDFQKRVWSLLAEIPYGKTTTYGEIASYFGNPMYARAIGNAVGANPIPIIIPCHRVIGAGNKLGGFSLGKDIKQKLLQIEKITLE